MSSLPPHPPPPEEPNEYGNGPYAPDYNTKPSRRIPIWVWIIIASVLVALLVCGGLVWTVIRAVNNAEDPYNAPRPAPSSLQLPEPSATPSETAHRASKAAEGKFLLEIHNYDGFGNVSEGKVLKLGYSICTSFALGHSYSSLVFDAEADGVTEADSEFIIKSAVVNLCPEYTSELP